MAKGQDAAREWSVGSSGVDSFTCAPLASAVTGEGLNGMTYRDKLLGFPARAGALKLLSAACFASVLALSGSAFAEEPRKVGEPRVLAEPSEITHVVDAFDDDDDFDAHITLGYHQTWRSAKIRRETFINQSGLAGGDFTATNLNVAEYSESTSRLNTKAEIGIYKDIAFIIRLPVILSNSRELSALDGSDHVQSVVLQGEPGEQLFSLPFKSPTRSGIEYLALGFDFGIMNQYRDRSKPTWVFGFEGRFNVSEPMHACNANPKQGQRDCADPSDINRNGQGSEEEFIDDLSTLNTSLEGNFSGGRSAGVSRGTTGLEVHTYLSKRIKYIEPYGGFAALFEFQNDNSDYGRTDLQGSLVNHPPFRGSLIMGLEVFPWEVRDRFQRISFDFRFTGTYVSEGRDYSELFDALGSSDAASLRYPNFAAYQENPDSTTAGEFPSVVNPQSQKVYFTGLTDVQQHGEYRLSGAFTWMANEYVKFNVGAAYTLVQGHIITFDQPCNPDFKSSDQNKSGPCRTVSGETTTVGGQDVTGIPNPNYRAAVNVPGRRFKVDDSQWIEAWINATLMF